MDKHTLAAISIAGSCLDVLGALYLAYDLLGGEHGPLRILTRGVTYGALFGIGYGVGLGPLFGIAAGIAHGITLAWEYSHYSKNAPAPRFRDDAVASAIRGAGFALGAAYLYGIVFAVVFGALSTAGQIVAYQFGIRPTLDYQPALRPRLTARQFWAAMNRTAGYAVAGYFSAAIANRGASALGIGLRIGLTIGLLTIFGIACTPVIEWLADHIPERRMGVAGVVLILVGFSLQSVQYWAVIFDLHIQ